MADKEASDTPDEEGPKIERRPVGFFWHEMFDADETMMDAETLIIAARRRKVAALYAENKSMAEIANMIEPKVSVMTIWRDIQACYQWFKLAAARSVADHLAFAMMRLDWLEAEVTEQWQRSKGARVKTHGAKKVKPGKPEQGKDGKAPAPSISYAEESSRFERIETYGDPRLFAEMRAIWDRRVELFGLIKREMREGGAGGDQPERIKLVAGLDPMTLV